MPAYHPNAAKGMALGYAISERGACHLRGAPLSEVLGGADPLTPDAKAQLFREHQSESALWNSAVLCCFPGFGMNLKELWQLVNAVTGFEYGSVKEFEQVGERISTLCRLFNTREGFDRRQDTLPARNLSQSMAEGPARGQVVELDGMLDDYYARMGWDKNGIPTMQRLSDLGLDQLLPPNIFQSISKKELDQ
jgi:aldehyde:ferredoxin oxidoreductase